MADSRRYKTHRLQIHYLQVGGPVLLLLLGTWLCIPPPHPGDSVVYVGIGRILSAFVAVDGGN